MTILLCRAVVATAFLTKAKPETQSEQEFFEAKSAELSRATRRRRTARLAAVVKTIWADLVDRLMRHSREAEARKDLREKLETMPPHILRDIGVNRDQMGRFCFHNEFGMMVELAAVEVQKPAAKAQPIGQLARAVG